MSLTVQREVLKAESVANRRIGQVVIDQELFLPEFEPEPEKVLVFLAEPIRVELKPGAGVQGTVTGLVAAEAIYQAVEASAEKPVSAARWSEAAGTAIPFESTVELPGVASDDRLQAWAVIDQAEAVPGGEHSLMAHIVLTVYAKVGTTSQYSVVSEMSAAPPVLLKVDRQEFDAVEPVGTKNRDWAIDEELILPASMPDAARVIWWNVRVIEAATQIEGNLVKLHGQLACEVFYLSEAGEDGENGSTLQCARWVEGSGNAVRFSTEVEWSGLPAGCLINSSVRLRGATVEAPDPRRMRLQARLGSRLEARVAKTVRVITECHTANGELLDIQRQPILFAEYYGAADGQYTVRETLHLPAGAPNLERPLSVLCRANAITSEVATDKVLVEGRLALTLLYLAEADSPADEAQLYSVEWDGDEAIGFETALDLPGALPGGTADVTVQIRDIFFEIAGSAKIQIEVKLAARAEAVGDLALASVTDAALVVATAGVRRASMVFCVVQPGETMWNIARRYNTTVARIAAANGLGEKDSAPAGKKLLIPEA